MPWKLSCGSSPVPRATMCFTNFLGPFDALWSCGSLGVTCRPSLLFASVIVWIMGCQGPLKTNDRNTQQHTTNSHSDARAIGIASRFAQAQTGKVETLT